MDTKITKILFYSLLIALFSTSCYYDKEDDLYPFDSSQNCDTLNMTYTTNIQAILENNGCVSCHSTSGPSGGVVLDNYDQVKIVADNGRLFGSVNYDDGYSPMPKGGSKLSDCDLAKIKAWINDGSPE